MGKEILSIPANSKIESVNLELANNAGVILRVEYKTPYKTSGSKLEQDWRWGSSKGAYSSYKEAIKDMDALAQMMGVDIDADGDEEEDDDAGEDTSMTDDSSVEDDMEV